MECFACGAEIGNLTECPECGYSFTFEDCSCPDCNCGICVFTEIPCTFGEAFIQCEIKQEAEKESF